MPKPVLIFNSVAPKTVAIARSLHRRGIPVTVVDIGGTGGSPRSRAIRDFVRLPNYEKNPAGFIEQLIALVQTGGHDTLFPCSDVGLVAVSEYYDRLAPLLYLGCPAPHIVRRVLDKDHTLDAAHACGVLVPLTYDAADISALEGLQGSLPFPIIAKPRSKAGQRAHPFKARYFSTFENLRDAFLVEPEFGTRNLLQEYSAGEGVGIEVLLHDGEPLALFQHRRLKELPISGGGSVLCVSEPVDPTLADSAVRLLRRLEWQGIAMVEFRYDHDTGKATLMEVNGRYWGSLPLAIRAGVDFPLYEWQLARGEKPAMTSSYRVGLRVRFLSYDLLRLNSLFADVPQDDFPLPSKRKELVRFVKDSLIPTSPAIWSWRDPHPAISDFTNALRYIRATFQQRTLGRAKALIADYRYLGLQNSIAYLTIRCFYALGLKHDRPPSHTSGLRSILFVCRGNKIRSPMAEAQLLRCIAESPCRYTVSTSSAEFSSRHEQRVDARAKLVAREFGISLDDYHPQRLTPEIVEEADAICVMDNLSESRLRVLYPQAMGKVFYLGVYSGTKPPPRNAEIPDPNLEMLADIRTCYRMIEGCVRRLEETLRSERVRSADSQHLARVPIP